MIKDNRCRFRFADAALGRLLEQTGDDYHLTVGMVKAESELLIAELIKQYGATNVRLQYRVVVDWKESDGDVVSQTFRFSDAKVNELADKSVTANAYAEALRMTIVNASELSDLVFTAQLVALNAEGKVLVAISSNPIAAN